MYRKRRYHKLGNCCTRGTRVCRSPHGSRGQRIDQRSIEVSYAPVLSGMRRYSQSVPNPALSSAVRLRRVTSASLDRVAGGATLTFLGFCHVWGKSRKGKRVVRQVTAKNCYSRALAKSAPWLAPEVRHGVPIWRALLSTKRHVQDSGSKECMQHLCPVGRTARAKESAPDRYRSVSVCCAFSRARSSRIGSTGFPTKSMGS